MVGRVKLAVGRMQLAEFQSPEPQVTSNQQLNFKYNFFIFIPCLKHSANDWKIPSGY